MFLITSTFSSILSTYHLDVQSGLMDNGVKHGLLGVWVALFVVFAARKFQQPIKVRFQDLAYCLCDLIECGVLLRKFTEIFCSYAASFSRLSFFCPLKDDIGDKSVFMFNALPEEEKEALVRKLKQQSSQELD